MPSGYDNGYTYDDGGNKVYGDYAGAAMQGPGEFYYNTGDGWTGNTGTGEYYRSGLSRSGGSRDRSGYQDMLNGRTKDPSQADQGGGWNPFVSFAPTAQRHFFSGIGSGSLTGGKYADLLNIPQRGRRGGGQGAGGFGSYRMTSAASMDPRSAGYGSAYGMGGGGGGGYQMQSMASINPSMYGYGR